MMFPRNIWIKNRELEALSAPVRFVSFHNPDQRGRGLVLVCFPVDSLPSGKGIQQVVSRGKKKTPRPGNIQ
jgi:hypothetical protein